MLPKKNRISKASLPDELFSDDDDDGDGDGDGDGDDASEANNERYFEDNSLEYSSDDSEETLQVNFDAPETESEENNFRRAEGSDNTFSWVVI